MSRAALKPRVTATDSQAEQAYRSLEHRLVTLEFAPGAWLQEQAVASSLRLGRTPVREALQRLAAAGMLQVLPRKGLQVAPMRRSDLVSVIETRRVLERLLAVKAVQRADPTERARLRNLAERLSDANGGPEGFYTLDRDLDDALAAAAHSPYLAGALEPLHMHCRRLWYRQRRSLEIAGAIALHATLARSVAGEDNAGAIGAVNGIIAVLESLLDTLDD